MLLRHRTGLALLALCAWSSQACTSADQNTTSGGGGVSGPRGGAGGGAGTGGSSGATGSGGAHAGAGGGGAVGTGGASVGETGGSGGVSTGSGGGAGGLAAGAAGNSGRAGGSGGPAGGGGSHGGASGGVSQSGGGSGGEGPGGSASDGGTSEDGEYLYTYETFGGNGRTCVSCHTATTGTISPDQVQALYASNPKDPLFQPIDSDDGVGTTYTQLQQHATIRVTIPLPSGVHLVSNPSATSITVRRAIPTTINTPALDPNLMWDGREPDLPSQALSAIQGHAQATIVPTMTQLNLIADYEKTFFSSTVLQQYAAGGAAPTWPAGTTDSEKRGRRWFVQDSAAPQFNICGQCHGGPMTNETQQNSGLPVGKHFQTVDVSEFNLANNPTYQLTFPDPKNPGKTIMVTTPDPGRALITGSYNDLNFFKIPPLWGVKNTAPYFHDNSAATFSDLMVQYKKHMATFLPSNVDYPSPHVPTDQDIADIIAYLELL